MDGGFNVEDMWNKKTGTIYEDDKWAKIDAIGVILNRINVVILILYIIVIIVSIIVGTVISTKFSN